MPEGYEISGDVRSGIHAVVPYFVAWNDAITLVNEVLDAPSAIRIGGIAWNAPYQFPVNFGGRTPPIYVQSWKIEPRGANGLPLGPTSGLAPGDFFTHAIVTLQFDSVLATQQLGDDPGNLNQLDPENPITACEQSVKINGKVVTRKGSAFIYDPAFSPILWESKPVPGDIPVIQNEVKLVCKFPRVPYLPWQLIQPYVSKVNKTAILNCATESLLLEGFGSEPTPMTDGSMGQKLVLEFAFNPDPSGMNLQGMSWNNFPVPDGAGYYPVISKTGSNKIYTPIDFSAIFTGLEF